MSQLLQEYHCGPAGPPLSRLRKRTQLVILAATCAMLISACARNDSSVIDSLGSAPLVLSASISPAVVNLDTVSQNLAMIPFTAIARVTHQNGPAQIATVKFAVMDQSGDISLATGQLFDNGVLPDVKAGDSIYTSQITIPTQSLPVGKYYCQIDAQDLRGFTSNTYLLPITIGRQLDHPPVLSDVQAPDTIFLGGVSQQFKLTVKATDPDGESDIARVYFNSFKPNGTAASGNPFLMYDDGSENVVIPPDFTSGDVVKGDSIYTLNVTINPMDSQGNPTALGGYRFEFQVSDRSNVLSQKLIKIIQVVQ